MAVSGAISLAAKRFLRRLLTSNKQITPRSIVTDKLGSYRLAHHELLPDAKHETRQYYNNRSESSHESTRVRERKMRRLQDGFALGFLRPGKVKQWLGGSSKEP